MSKLKQPLLSLEAHGSIADTLTYQRRKGVDFTREKPRLPYFLTLPSQYQRWLYEDYCYLWRQQSAATKQEYASAGSRHHLTGFQYWMKYQLTNLPDIAGMWYLDEKSGAVAHDYSRNANHGVIIGPSPAVGVIDGAFLFDGINDLVNLGSGASLKITDIITIETWLNPAIVVPDTQYFIGQYLLATDNNALRVLPNNKVRVYRRIAGVASYEDSGIALSNNVWTHVAYVGNYANFKIYFNGIDTNAVQVGGVHFVNWNIAADILAGKYLLKFYKGLMDELRFYTRALDLTTIIRHAERRWPR